MSFVIKEPVYASEIRVFDSGLFDAVVKDTRRRHNVIVEPFENEAAVFASVTGIPAMPCSYLWISDQFYSLDNASKISILAHEMTHAAHHTLRTCDVMNDNEFNPEAMAYLVEYYIKNLLVKMVSRNVNSKKRKSGKKGKRK